MCMHEGRECPGRSCRCECMNCLTGDEVPMDEALEEARKLGEQAGRDAASWVFDGNTDDSYYRQVLKWIEDGDPLMDSVEEPSGDAREVCEDIGLDYDTMTVREADRIIDAWREEASPAFWHEVERLAREHLSCGQED